MANFFDQFDPPEASSGGNFFDQFDEPAASKADGGNFFDRFDTVPDVQLPKPHEDFIKRVPGLGNGAPRNPALAPWQPENTPIADRKIINGREYRLGKDSGLIFDDKNQPVDDPAIQQAFGISPALTAGDYGAEAGKAAVRGAANTIGGTIKGAALATTSDPKAVAEIEAGIANIKSMPYDQAEAFRQSIKERVRALNLNPLAAVNYEAALRATWRGDTEAAKGYLDTARTYSNTDAVKDQPIYQAGKYLTDQVTKDFKQDPRFADSWWSMIFEGAGSTVPFIPAGFGGPTAVAGLGALASGSEGYDSARRDIENGKFRDDRGGLYNAGYGSEAENVARKAGQISMAPGLSEAAPIELLVDQTIGRLPFFKTPAGAKLWQRGRAALMRVGAQVLAEGGQEGFQTWANNIINQIMVDPSQSQMEGVPESAAVGGIVGGGMQIGAEAVGAITGGDDNPINVTPQPPPSPGAPPAAGQPGGPRIDPTLFPNQPGPTTAGPGAPGAPPPAGPAQTPSNPGVTGDQTDAYLVGAGYTPEQIADMNPEERRAALQEALDQGVQPVPVPPAPSTPTAAQTPPSASAGPAPAPAAPATPAQPPAGPGIWANKDSDQPVTILDEPAQQHTDGRTYQAVDAGQGKTYVPADELVVPQAAPAAPTGTTFQTAKGSTYEVHEDGTTTRNKAYRPEHGPAEQGPQPRSQTTFYVPADQINRLDLVQAQTPYPVAIVEFQPRTWGIAYTDGPDKGKIIRDTVVQPEMQPAVGLTPVELWKDGRVVHFGNPITSVGTAAAPAQDVKSPAPADDLDALLNAAFEQEFGGQGVTSDQNSPPNSVGSEGTPYDSAVSTVDRATVDRAFDTYMGGNKPLNPEAFAKFAKIDLNEAGLALQRAHAAGRIIPSKNGNYRRPPTRIAPLDVLELLASKGGVSDPTGELKALDLHKPQYNTPRYGPVVRKSGMHPDKARELLVEMGYMDDAGRDSGGQASSTVADFYELMGRAAAGEKIYARRDQEQAAGLDAERRNRDLKPTDWEDIHPIELRYGPEVWAKIQTFLEENGSHEEAWSLAEINDVARMVADGRNVDDAFERAAFMHVDDILDDIDIAPEITASFQSNRANAMLAVSHPPFPDLETADNVGQQPQPYEAGEGLGPDGGTGEIAAGEAEVPGPAAQVRDAGEGSAEAGSARDSAGQDAAGQSEQVDRKPTVDEFVSDIEQRISAGEWDVYIAPTNDGPAFRAAIEARGWKMGRFGKKGKAFYSPARDGYLFYDAAVAGNDLNVQFSPLKEKDAADYPDFVTNPEAEQIETPAAPAKTKSYGSEFNTAPKVTTEKGADNKEQLVIPGAEQDRKGAMQNAAQAPLKGTAPQQGMDIGLFGSERDQTDMFDANPEPKPAATKNPGALSLQGNWWEPLMGGDSPSKSKTTEKASKKEDAGQIEDFGEKILGARKDAVRDIVKSLEEDINVSTEPLSKSFPQPDYEKLAEAGVDRKALALIASMREYIPSKPRQSWKLKDYVYKVTIMRDFAQKLLKGEVTAAEILDKMKGPEFRPLIHVANTADVISAIEPRLLPYAAQYKIRSGGVSMLRGERFSPAKHIFYLEDPKGRWLDVDAESLDGVRDAAVAYIKSRAEKELGAKGTVERRTPLNLYQDRHTKEYFIGFKGVRGVIRLKAGFEKGREAREYMKEHADELQAQIDQMREGPDLRRSSNMPRKGPFRREGDATPALFDETFGFRGVQFGNYVESDRRQSDLNEAFDALMDMADALGIPPKAISLDGRLGLAFGARGHGGKNAAAAHYEPTQIVINLTKHAGPGSLAHEWLHAADHYFSRQNGAGEGRSYISEAKQRGDVREPVWQAWKDLEKAISRGPFAVRSDKLDEAKSKPYYGTTIEKAARAFEKYIVDKLNEKQTNNDYLANIELSSGAYPLDEEMQKDGIRKAFDDLFASLDVRWSEDKKKAALFSVPRRPANRQSSIPASAAITSGYSDTSAMMADPDYRAAKAGDGKAAVAIVARLVPANVITHARVNFGPSDIFVPVSALEQSGQNQIPVALAHYLAEIVGGSAETEIVQSSKAKHTQANPIERLLRRPSFVGPVKQGARYVLVDDVTVLGGTLAELANHIQSNGGQVAGVVTLVNTSRNGLKGLSPATKEQARDVERRFGNEVRSAFGVEPSALTFDEAQYLRNFRDADRLRDRIAAAGGAVDGRAGEGNVSERSAGDKGPQGRLNSTPLSRGARFDGIVSKSRSRRDSAQQEVEADLARHGIYVATAPDGNSITVTPSTYEDGMLQVTYFTGQEPSGHFNVRPENIGQELLSFSTYRRKSPMQSPLASVARPIFYSGLLRAVEGMKQEKAPKTQWMGMIRNAPGVKPEEIAWIGLEDWLSQQEGAITRQQLVDFIKANQVEVSEVVKERKRVGGYGSTQSYRNKLWEMTDQELADEYVNEFGIDREDALQTAIDEPSTVMQELVDRYERTVENRGAGSDGFYVEDNRKFASYQMPGGENYRELLITAPEATATPEERAAGRLIDSMVKKYGDDFYDRMTAEEKANYERLSEAAYKSPVKGSYTSGHWNEQNVVAHIRFNERTDADGKKVLFVEEIQSDWHQTGRKDGYRTAEAAQALVDAKAKVWDMREAVYKLLDKNDFLGFDNRSEAIRAIRDESPTNWDWETPEDLATAQAYHDAMREQRAAQAAVDKGVPDAPFKTTWPELAMKRVIRWAAENGFERVAWTPGNVQNERYSLSTYIDAIAYQKRGDVYGLEIREKNAHQMRPMGEHSADQLVQQVGKEMADKIVNGEGKTVGFYGADKGWAVLDGLDLKVGGSGMTGFYDKMLVDVANKLGKKFSSKVSNVKLPGAATYEQLVEAARRTGLSQQELDAMPVAERKQLIDRNTISFPSFDITPEMRDAAMQGQPLFKKQAVTNPAPWAPKQPVGIIEKPKLGDNPYQTFLGKRQAAQLLHEVEQIARRILGHHLVGVNVYDRMPNGQNPHFDPNDELINMALRCHDDPRLTIRHEAMHLLRQAGVISAHQWAVLSRVAKSRWIEQYDIRYRYEQAYRESMDITQSQLDELMTEEAVADAFAEYWTGNNQGETVAERIFYRIKQFLEAVANLARGYGFTTADSVFGQIESGEIAQRQRGTGQDRGFMPYSRQQPAPLESRQRPPRNPTPGGFEIPHDERVFRALWDSTDTLLNRIRRAGSAVVTKYRRGFQDREIDLSRTQANIAKASGPIPEGMDAYLASSLYPGRVAQKDTDLVEDFIKPLVADIAARKLSLEEVDEFLIMQHAIERNAAIGAIHKPGTQFNIALTNPAVKGGSGFSTDEVNAAMARWRASGKLADLTAVGNKVVALNKRTLRSLLNEGLITQEIFDTLTNKYQNYVPLRGEDDVTNDAHPDTPRSGRRFDVRGKDILQAFGRTTKADSPLAYSIMQARQALIRVEKNRVGKRFLRLAQANPNEALWEVNRVDLKKGIDSRTGYVRNYYDPNSTQAENVFAVKVGGQPYHVTIHHDGLLQAMKGLGKENMGDIGAFFSKINRYFSAINTSYSPEFLFTNFLRDLQHAGIVLQEEDVRGLTTSVLGSIPQAFEGMRRMLLDDLSTPWARYAREFADAGGKIGFLDRTDIEGEKDNLAKLMRDANAGMTGKLWIKTKEHTAERLARWNDSLENTLRLATYVQLRNRGVTQDKAASVARELTVNFNRKGEYSPAINAGWLFFNASSQGAAQLIMRLTRSKAVRRVAMGIVVEAFLMGLLNHWMAGDDDDKKNRFDKIPDDVKAKYHIFMLTKEQEKQLGAPYIKIPLPLGWNIFHVFGTQLAEMLSGSVTPLEAATNSASAVGDAFNILGSSGGFLHMLAPTVLDPAVTIWPNTDDFGEKLVPDRYDETTPNAERYNPNVAPWARTITDTLSSWTGGSPERSGAIDLSPEWVEYVTKWLGGGVTRFFGNLSTTAQTLGDPEEFDVTKMPFARVFAGQPSKFTDRDEYNQIRDAVHVTKKEIEGRSKEGDREAAAAVRTAHPREVQMIYLVDNAEKRLMKLRKAYKATKNAVGMGDALRKKRLEQITEQMNKVQLIVRTRWNDLGQTRQ